MFSVSMVQHHAIKYGVGDKGSKKTKTNENYEWFVVQYVIINVFEREIIKI